MATDLIIYCLIRQGVLFLVHCPWQILYLNTADLCNQFLGPGMQQFQTFVLHFVAAVDLLDEQLGVREQLTLDAPSLTACSSPVIAAVYSAMSLVVVQILRDPFQGLPFRMMNTPTPASPGLLRDAPSL